MINTVDPFRFWCQKVLPLVYDDSISYYETLCKVVQQLNEFGKITNEMVEIINKLPESIREGVINVLNSMLSDGTLEKLINESLFKSKVDKIEPRSTDLKIHAKVITKIDGAYALQGLCHTQGNNIVMAFYNNIDNQVIIREQNIKTGKIVKENMVTAYHANSITFDSYTNEIVIAPAHTSEGEKLPFLVILDYETLEFKKTRPLSDVCYNDKFPFGIAYNRITHEYYILTSNYSEWTVAIFDGEFNLIKTVELNVDNTGITAQGIETDGNYIYITRWQPQCIHVYDLNFNLIKNFNVPLYADGIHPIIELEEICYAHDDMFYCGFNTWTTQDRNINNYTIAQINLQKNVVEGSYYYPGAGSPTWFPTIWVDKDNTNKCPDGTSENPFTEIQDAINIMNGGFFKGYQISVKKAGLYKGIMIRFTGNNLLILNTSGGRVEIEGAIIQQSQSVTFNGINFIKPYGNYNSVVRCEGSDVKFIVCDFANDFDYHLYGSLFSKISNYTSIPENPNIYLSHSIYDTEPWKSNQNILFTTSTCKLQKGHIELYSAGKIAFGSVPLRISANYFTNIKIRIRVNDAFGEYRYIRPVTETVINAINVADNADQAQLYEMRVIATTTTFTILQNRMYDLKSGVATDITDPTIFGVDLIYGE